MKTSNSRPSVRSRLVRSLIVRPYLRKVFDLEKTAIEQMRQNFVKIGKRNILPRGTVVERTTAAGLPAEWVIAANVPKDSGGVILHFHGGGIVGSCDTHRYLASLISKASGVRVLVVEYRLAPEHKYPAANDDCLAAYRWLIENCFSPESIIIGGDSFGAGLALMTLLSLRDAGDTLPAAAYLFSPWDFIRFDGESYKSRAKIDPLANKKSYQICADSYIGSSASKPVSLFDRNMAGLPDLLIQTGDHEVVLSDSVRIAENTRKAGMNVALDVWNGMWHGFQGFAAVVPEASQALDNVGRFVKDHLACPRHIKQ